MPKLYLLGGENVSQKSARTVNAAAFEDAGGRPRVVIFTWARPSFDKAYSKRRLLEDYFRRLGAESVEYADYNQAGLTQKIAEADVVYFTGGQASILIERAKNLHLEKYLRGFIGIIVGRSAGALALCSRCVTTQRYSGKVRVIDGLGLVDITLKTHYIERDDGNLERFSFSKPVYAVPKDSALIYDNGSLTALGEVYLFNGGKRQLFIQTCL